MEVATGSKVLVSGASFAGLATAFWMQRLGYDVTVVEVATSLKRGGTPVNIRNRTVAALQRMGLFEQVERNRIVIAPTEFIDSGYAPAPERPEHGDDGGDDDVDYEIERDVLLDLLYDALDGGVRFLFGDSIVSLEDVGGAVDVSFGSGGSGTYDLVFGCDGIHSNVRGRWFGEEARYSHFLQAYGCVIIVDGLLADEGVSQMYNEPGKTVLLNTYNGKTDIILIFFAEREILFDYRDDQQKRDIILREFADVGWRTPELLDEVRKADSFYFHALNQIRMPAWTRGRVALVGDAGYCASPAAGMGGSLAIDGATALGDAFAKCDGDHRRAFEDYETTLRPFIEKVQADAVDFGVKFLVPRTADAIRERFQ